MDRSNGCSGTPFSSSTGRPYRILLSGLLILMGMAVLSCSGDRVNARSDRSLAAEAMPVTVAAAIQKTMPVEVSAIGNVEAYSTVSIKALVSGELVEVHFQEGQDIRKGDLLFRIDPRPFESALKRADGNLSRDTAQLHQAEANLAKDTVQAKNADVQLHRYEDLFKEGVVAKELFDQFRTTADAFDATLQADRAAIEFASAAIGSDKAAIESAKLDLGYCTIRSPMDGRTGNLLVHPGNIVKASTADNLPLVVINQIQPIYVSFSVPEQYLTDIKRQMSLGRLGIAVSIPKEEAHLAEGILTFVDNTVDRSTGTIRLKATIQNREKMLWPGQFVDVALKLSTRPNATVVPSRALQNGQSGQYVFVVKSDFTVEPRPIVAGLSLRGETVVEKGLQPGETVVTDGQLRLSAGAKVRIKAGADSTREKGT